MPGELVPDSDLPPGLTPVIPSAPKASDVVPDHDLPPELKGATAPRKYPVSYPSEAMPRAEGGVGSFLKRNAIPMGAMGATGLALDALLPEAGIPATIAQALLRGGASGAVNAALTKKLPPSLGGQPTEPVGESFLFGAAPELAMGVPATVQSALRGRVNKAATSAAEAIPKRLDPDAQRIAELTLSPKAGVPFPNRLSGTGLTNATDEARAPVQSIIQSARKRYGEPLGRAYQSLKGEEPLTEDEAAALGDSAQKVVAGLNSPAPQTQRFAGMLTKLAKPAEQEGPASILKPIELPDGSIVVPGAAKMTPEALKMQGYSDKQIEKLLLSKKEWQPPTLDRLRGIWQEMGKAEDTAKGGDEHGLPELRQLLEGHLNEHLGPEWKELRKNYRGFIKRWSRQDARALSNLGTPQEVADWTFKDPEYAHELMVEAHGTPKAGQLQQLFLQHVYGPLNDTTMSQAKQLSEVRKRLAPYFKDPDTAKLIMGNKPGQVMTQLLAWPRDVENFRQNYKNPQFQKSFVEGVKAELLGNRKLSPEEASNRVIGAMQQGNPQLTQQIMKQLPAPEAAARRNPMGMRMPMYHGMMLAGGLGTVLAGGHMGFGMSWQATALAAWLLADRIGSYSAASRLGITVPLLKAMRSGGYGAGKMAARALLDAGARKGQEQDVELNDYAAMGQ